MNKPILAFLLLSTSVMSEAPSGLEKMKAEATSKYLVPSKDEVSELVEMESDLVGFKEKIYPILENSCVSAMGQRKRRVISA